MHCILRLSRLGVSFESISPSIRVTVTQRSVGIAWFRTQHCTRGIMGGVKVVYDDIKQSPEDKRFYRGLQLANGLRALLISDPTTDKSSAALQVGVGNMCDPPGLPGLAHFCEHMLFLGTKKYPDEQEYNRYLSEHGGASNASTSSEHTTYFFDVAPDALSGALDRFAQFFICPLFTPSATDREVNAVNSENEKNIQMDSRRLLQVSKSTYDQSHPYSHFGTGNKETLMTRPQQDGVDTRQELLAFHSRYYSANIMTLCVLGKESLNEIEALVMELFSDVENKDVVVADWEGHPLGQNQLQHQILTIPVKNIRTLKIQWPLPDLHEHYKVQPLGYFSHLLGHEGPGSVYSEIRKRGWATGLSAGGRRLTGFGFMEVTVDLSEEGLEHTDDIVTLIFQYLNMLREHGPQEWIQDERKELNSVDFRFKDKELPRQYTVRCVGRLMDYPIPEVLCGHTLVEDYKPEVLSSILDALRPENCRTIIRAKKFAGQLDQKEPWYGVEYSDRPLSKDLVEAWKTCGVHSSLQLPAQNAFIPTKFDLAERDEKGTAAPRLIRQTDMTELWFRQDDCFLLPKAGVSVIFTSPEVYTEPERFALTELCERVFIDSLNEYSYAADLAGLDYDLMAVRHGLRIVIFGYNDKLKVLLEKVMDRLVNMPVDPDRFKVLKEKYIRSLQNYSAEQPHTHASYYTDVMLADVLWTKTEKLAQAQNLTPADLQAFLPTLLSQLHTKVLVYGNMDKQEAECLSRVVTGPLESRGTVPLPTKKHKLSQTVELPKGTWHVLRQENAVHATSALKVYYQVGEMGWSNNMQLELLAQIVKQPCFDTLRTKEQLGYIVFSGVHRLHGIQGLYITVQSTHRPEYLEKRVEAFVHGLRSHLVEMSEEVYTNHVEALATRRLEKAKNLWQQQSRYVSEISNNYYYFNRDEEEVAYLRTLSKGKIIKFYEDHIASGAPGRCKLSVHIPSAAPTPADTPDTSVADTAEGEDTPYNGPQPVTIQHLPDLPSVKGALSRFPPPAPAIQLTVVP